MRVRRQADQRRASFLVPLRSFDDGNLGTVGRMHHLADVRKPLRACRVELPLDEVPHVRARRTRVEAVPERNALRAAPGFRRSAEESARVYQRLNPPSELIT